MLKNNELRLFIFLWQWASTAPSPPPTLLFAVVIFQMGSHFYALASLDLDLPIYASCIAGMTVVYHHAQLFID
jgi:hypothetical protein